MTREQLISRLDELGIEWRRNGTYVPKSELARLVDFAETEIRLGLAPGTTTVQYDSPAVVSFDTPSWRTRRARHDPMGGGYPK